MVTKELFVFEIISVVPIIQKLLQGKGDKYKKVPYCLVDNEMTIRSDIIISLVHSFEKARQILLNLEFYKSINVHRLNHHGC